MLHHAITWTNADCLLIEHDRSTLRWNHNQDNCPSKQCISKCRWKKWQAFCLSLCVNELIRIRICTSDQGLCWCSISEDRLQSHHSLSGRTSCHQISWNLEAARLNVITIVSLWNLQASRQPCCRSACQISERFEKSRGFETSRDFAVTRPSAYRIEALGVLWFDAC